MVPPVLPMDFPEGASLDLAQAGAGSLLRSSNQVSNAKKPDYSLFISFMVPEP